MILKIIFIRTILYRITLDIIDLVPQDYKIEECYPQYEDTFSSLFSRHTYIDIIITF